MNEGWENMPLGNICSIRRGLTYSKSDEVEKSDKVVLRSNNVDLDTFTLNFEELKYLKPDFDIPEDKYLKKGDLLMCMSNGSKAHLGKIALFNGSGKYAFGGFMSAIEHNDKVIDKYFYYSLTTKGFRDYIKALTDGANINNLKIRDIEAYTIPVPPLAEQQRIVDLLDAEFDKIELLKTNAEHQLQAAKDLYERIIEELFTENNGWTNVTIGDCFISINNGANIKQTKGASGIPITRIETLANGVFNPDRLGYANIEDASKYEKYLMKDGDLLMSHINSVEFTGRTVAYHNQIPVVIHGMNLLRLVPKDSIDSDFFVYLTKSKGFKESIRSITHKSVNQASFNTTALKAINIKVPDIEEQKVIVAKLDALSERVKQLQSNYEQTITLCNDLKQSLLKSIFK